MELAPATLPLLIAELTRQLAGFLAWLLAASALHKALDPAASVAAAAALTRRPAAAGTAAVRPGPGARALTVLAIVLEGGACALLFASGPLLRAGALLAAALFAAYGAALAVALREGRTAIDCGCHFGSHRPEIGGFDLKRNAVLIALAAAVLAGARWAAPLTLRHLLVGAGGLALYVALDAVRGLAPERRAA
ncbi:MAG TPA: MauE/DoxX family redox-associated membrane protein [Steroidobacteraceae bacterium]|nr:MauE/DoxX family redox-associated membrane protein [Steroidobacteraceae bacterium]